MSQNDQSVQDAAEEIHEQFADQEDVDVSVEEIREDIEAQTEYQVPLEEAKRAARSRIMDTHGVTPEDILSSGSPEVDIADIDEDLGDDKWISIEGEVLEIWDSDSDSIIQTGLIGDNTGKTKFTAWAASFDDPPLEEGETVAIDSAVTDEYQGRYSINLNKRTSIESIDAAFEVPDNEETVAGALVDIGSPSGLIKRCPEKDCTRVLRNGRCSEHGEVEGEFDLRIKGVLDDGEETHNVLFDREMTEDVGGITLEEAEELAMDALDTSVVADQLRSRLVGRYFEVSGPQFGDNLLVDEVETPEGPSVDDLLVQGRALQAEGANGGEESASAD